MNRLFTLLKAFPSHWYGKSIGPPLVIALFFLFATLTLFLISSDTLKEMQIDPQTENIQLALCQPNAIIDVDNYSTLHVAALCGDVAMIRQLIRQNSDINSKTAHDQKTPLHWAIRGFKTQAVATLLKLGANVNATDIFGSTPLHEAALYNNAEAIRLLIKKGADVNSFDENHLTPLFIAVANQQVDAIKSLIHNHANVNYAGRFDETPLMMAVSLGDNEAIQLLIAAGADINATEKNGNTALHIAAANGEIDIIQDLLQSHAKINITNGSGLTPIDVANVFSQQIAVEILQKAGGKLSDNQQ